MATTELATIEAELKSEVSAVEAAARGYLIVDTESYHVAAGWRRACKEGEAKAEAKFGPICKLTDQAHKMAVATRDEYKGAFARAGNMFGAKMADWDQEQVDIRRRAEEAQQRERERLETEERARVAAETARLRREEEDRRLAAALAAEARGDTATAQRIVTAPIEVEPVAPRPVFVPPVQVPEYQRPAGTTYAKRWVAELENLGELIGAVINGEIAPAVAVQLLTLNQAGATAYAKATRGTVKVPGLVFREVTDTRQR